MEDTVEHLTDPAAPPHPSLLVWLLGALGLVLVLGAGYVFYAQQFAPADPIVEAPLTQPEFAGQALYLSAAAADGSTGDLPEGYTLDLATGAMAVSVPYPVQSLQYVNEFYDTGALYLIEDEQTLGMQPFWYERAIDGFGLLDEVTYRTIQDVRSSPDGVHYAYSYLDTEVTDELDIQNWSIVIHNTETGQKVVIEEAVKPQWWNNGTELLHLTPDGIALYSLALDEQFIFYDEFTGLSRLDAIAAAPDARHVVLTVPTLQQMVTLAVTREDASTYVVAVADVAAQEGAAYWYPVISPDGRYVAALRFAEDAVSGATTVVVEVRQLADGAIVGEYTLPGVDPVSVRLSDWFVLGA